MCEVRRAVGFGNTKIGDPGVELGGDHDVGWLDIAMSDFVLVRVGEGFGHLRHDVDDSREPELL